jgi:YVTN family beta-propeller protein
MVAALLAASPNSRAATPGCKPISSYAGWVAKLRATEAFASPAGGRPVTVAPQGTTILPSGRLLRPAGFSTEIGGHPYGLALSRDGLTALTSNSGTVPFSLSLITAPNSAHPVVRTVAPLPGRVGAQQPAFFMGLAFSHDGLTAYASGGGSGTVQTVSVAAGAVTSEISLDGTSSGRTWRDSALGDMALSPDGTHLYVIDAANFRLVDLRVGPTGLSVVRSLPTGRFPFSVSLSPDGAHAYVAAVGTYEYKPIRGFDPADPLKTALRFPPFGAPTPASLHGAVVDGKQVPPLGSPNSPSAAAVWDYELAAGRVVGRTKTGPLVGQVVDGIPAVGTSAPAAALASSTRVFVSNNHSDTVAVLQPGTHRLLHTIKLTPTASVADLRGVQPFGLALSPDGRTLFVAESGLDAVAVVDIATYRVLGHVPTAWLPSKVAVSPDARTLYVANARGFGNGPNAAVGPGTGRAQGLITSGAFQALTLPDLRSAAGRAQLARWTGTVLANAGLGSHRVGTVRRGLVGTRPDVPVKHVVVVVKENRTYDQLLGDVGKVSNRTAIGDPTLAGAPVMGYGEHATVVGSVDPTKPQVLTDVDLTPNTHALARRFAFGDNFYSDAEVSADGHRWLVGVPPDAFVESSFPQSYGQSLDYSPETGPNPAPGRRNTVSPQAALMPEEYAEAGSLFESAARAHLTYYNFGEGLELADSSERSGALPTGADYGLNTPLPAALFDHSARDFPEFNTTINDQYREDVIERHLRRNQVGAAKGQLPQLMYVWLPQDHGGTPDAGLGYPYLQSFPADNDMALGRLVDTLSHRPDWSSTAVLVLEDDPQGGLDSVDAHRTLGLVISPWTKRGYVSGIHTSTSSVVKTVELLLGLPMLEQQDATANDLLDGFTDHPDLSPYNVIVSDPRVFDAGHVQRLGHPTAARSSVLPLGIDDPEDRPQGQPGGAPVYVDGQRVDESPSHSLVGPPRTHPQPRLDPTVSARAQVCPVVAGRRPGLAATGNSPVPAAVGIVLLGLAVAVRRRRQSTALRT